MKGAVGGQGGTTCPVPTTKMLPLDTTKLRARSRCLSTPTVAPSWTVTFLSKMADAGIEQDHRPVHPPRAVYLGSGDRMELRTSPPETMTPLLTTLLTAPSHPIAVLHELATCGQV